MNTFLLFIITVAISRKFTEGCLGVQSTESNYGDNETKTIVHSVSTRGTLHS